MVQGSAWKGFKGFEWNFAGCFEQLKKKTEIYARKYETMELSTLQEEVHLITLNLFLITSIYLWNRAYLGSQTAMK